MTKNPYIKPNRRVIVNTNRRGMVHEPTCRWLIGALNAGSLNHDSYQDMRADKVPADKAHCSHC
jgi:hypothetical protein